MIEYPFDPNNEESRLRQKLEEYYGEFSDNARNKLFAKNIERPTSAYDLMYPRQRESLLTKNETNIFDKKLDETSIAIRNALISANVSEQIDLIKTGESARQSLLARNKMMEEGDKLIEKTEAVRKGLLAKNSTNPVSLDQMSSDIRDSLISKNTQFYGTESSLLEKSEGLREVNVAKNVSKEGDLLSNSNETRESNIAKSKGENGDLEKESELYRKGNVFKNDKDVSTDPNRDLANDSIKIRDGLLSSNNTEEVTPLDLLFKSTREILISKGGAEGITLDDVSKAFRDAIVAKNVDNSQDISEMFETIRKSMLSANDSDSAPNLDSVSESIRKDNLSKNDVTESSLEELSKSIREGLVSANVSVKREDIISLYDTVRNGLTSANESKDIDLMSMFNFERQNLLSANSQVEGDLENESNLFRKDNVSRNEDNSIDLESFSKTIRDGNLSSNETTNSDLESFSEAFRDGNISNNSAKVTDIENDSVPARDGLLSYNTPKNTSIEADSVPVRDGLLSSNIPNPSDIETDSVLFRDDLLSSNVPNGSDIESDSVMFRDDLLSSNVPNGSDIESDSVVFRDDLLSSNVPNGSDIQTDSVVFRDDLLSSNVPSDSNIQTDSVVFRDDLLASNVPANSDLFVDSEDYRDGLLTYNNVDQGDLLSESQQAYFDNISANVSTNNSGLLFESSEIRDANISSNVSNNSDLLRDSTPLREQLKARNGGGGLLGVNINAAGTSTFLGVSRVLTQGILYRALLLPKNKYRKNRDEYDQGFDRVADNRYTSLNGASKVTTQTGIELSNDDIRLRFGYGPTSTSMDVSLTTSDRGALSLFGTGTRNEVQAYDANRDGQYYGDKTSISLPESDQTLNATILGSVTKAARDYNISRNNFAINGDDGLRNLGGYETLTNTNLVPGTSSTGQLQPALFDDLIQKTVGSIKNPEADTLSTPTTPFGVIVQNEGKYLKADPTDSLRPGVETLGTDTDTNPSLLMAKTVVQNPFYEESFQTEIRGVRSVINRIKNNSNIDFASNYDPQNSTSYATGLRPDQAIKRVGQRWTVKNPYAPGEAETLHFMLQNYSNGQKLYLPPYITSFQHGSSVNWNEHNFLGRPEALYTYSSSKRSGSISFFILTDYAQEVEMGLNYDDQTGEVSPYTENFNESFTQVTDSTAIEAEIKKIDKEIAEVNEQLAIAGGGGETANLERNKADLQATKQSLQKDKATADRNKARQPDGRPNFSESNRYFRNIYTDVIKGLNGSTEGVDYVDSKPESTVARLSYMKRQLMFQPSYFSGDKLDFLKRMEFLEKMTRPSRAPGIRVQDENGVGDDKFIQRPGFSFINPPICHIHLGDWINHDVVINSIDYDYTDSPWTTGGGGRVQPMWCQVTMSFDMIGRYKHAAGDAVLSTDRGGFFSI